MEVLATVLLQIYQIFTGLKKPRIARTARAAEKSDQDVIPSFYLFF